VAANAAEGVIMATLEQALRPKGYPVPPYREAEMKLVLSLTGDILAFRRCARQYGMQSVRGFALAHATQEFVGTFAHRSLARAFRHYREQHRAPTNAEMAGILNDVRELLREQKRRPHSWDVVRKVGCRVMRLNRSFETFGVYERIVDSERSLQTDDEEFVIQGRVDVIQRGAGIELWDYKATQDPRRVIVSNRRVAVLILITRRHRNAWRITPSSFGSMRIFIERCTARRRRHADSCSSMRSRSRTTPRLGGLRRARGDRLVLEAGGRSRRAAGAFLFCRRGRAGGVAGRHRLS